MSNHRILPAAALAALATLSVLLAQSKTQAAQPRTQAAQPSNRFVPRDSAVVLRVASPTRWRERFARTQASKLMNGATLAPLMQMATQRLDLGLQQLRDQGVFDAKLVDGLLNEWRGDLIVSLQMDWDNFVDAMDYGEVPPLSFVIALTSDGSFDLAAVAKEFASMVDKTKPADQQLVDLVVGDLTLRRTDNGGDEPDAALPTMIDGSLVMIGGTSLAKDAKKLLARTDRFAGAMGAAPLYLHADLGKAMKAMMAADNGGGPVDPGDLMDMIGIGALRDLTLTLQPDGTAVAGVMEFGMGKTGRGMLDMYPRGSARPRLLGAVPATSESFSVSSFDLMALYNTVADVWTSMEDFTPLTFDDMLDGFQNATKVHLKDDLLAMVGKEMLMVQQPNVLEDADFDDLEDNPAAMLNGTVFGLSLLDGKAFGASLDTALRSRGLHVGRKSEEHAGTKVYRMKLAGLVEVEYAVLDDLLLIGVEPGARATLRSVLDTRAAGRQGLPAGLQQRFAAFPKGWNSVAVTPVGESLEAMVGIFAASGELGEQGEMFAQMAKALTAEMKQLGISGMASATYCDDDKMVSRFRW
jgi:hypothetical protein